MTRSWCESLGIRMLRWGVLVGGCASLAACVAAQRDGGGGFGGDAGAGEIRATLPSGKDAPADAGRPGSDERSGPTDGATVGQASPADALAAYAADMEEFQTRLAAMRSATPRQTPGSATPADPDQVARDPSFASPRGASPRGASPRGQASVGTASGSGASASAEDAGSPPLPISARLPDAPTSEDAHPSSAVADSMVAAVNAGIDRALAADAGRPIARALADAALSIGEPERAFDAGTFGLDADDRALAERFHAACRTIGRQLADGASAAEATVALAGLVDSLKPPEDLRVPRIELCTSVEGFGRLTPIQNKRFLPGRGTQFVLYTEVAGFASELDAKGQWNTRLSTRLTILARHDGTPVSTREWTAVVDESAVRRQDFFICEKVTLSDLLTLGTYVLRVSVRDERTGAIAERSLEFQMVADPALAGR